MPDSMIGIMGGAFDPVHHGHLRPALDVLQALRLEQLRLIPLRDPPHRDRPQSTDRQRLEMLRAAVRNVPRLTVDARELERTGKSYTVDTLKSLREELGEKSSLCLLLGTDAFRGFPDWRRPDEILQLAHIIVMQRPGEPHPEIHRERMVEDPESLKKEPAGLIHCLAVTQLEISSTAIRDLVRRGQSPRFLLPDAVLDLIERQGLYLD